VKRLILIRHAKSDWADPSLKDFDRPLNARGLRDAPKMSERLVIAHKSIDAIISSPAQRAKSTAAFFANVYLDKKLKVQFEPRIYDASIFQLFGIVTELDSELDTVILVGHNPGFSELTTYLCGVHIQMPTCAVAELVFEVDDWKLISANSGRLVGFDYPKKEI